MPYGDAYGFTQKRTNKKQFHRIELNRNYLWIENQFLQTCMLCSSGRGAPKCTGRQTWIVISGNREPASRLLCGVGFTPCSTPRGIPQNKKREIETKLCSMMPECRRVFWSDLSVNDNSDDLIDSQWLFFCNYIYWAVQLGCNCSCHYFTVMWLNAF